MAFISDTALDAALAYVAACDMLTICSAEPTTHTQAIATYRLGECTTLTWGAAANASPNGRKISSVAIAFADGDVLATGTATHWAVISTFDDTVRATGALSASQAVTAGNNFSLASFDVRIPDAV